jgi:histidine triad (HIT) family protein
MPECLFCQIAAGNIPCHKIYEDENVLAFLDIHPLNPGHTQIIPKKHSGHLLEADEIDARAIMDAAKKITPAILQCVGAPGCNFHSNIGRAAGQVIFHTHVHLIPRYADDGFQDWERTGEVSDGLASVAERIRDFLKDDGCADGICSVKNNDEKK